MRTIQDADGCEWDAMVGRASWGAFQVLFVPREGETGARQAHLDATSAQQAERALAELSGEQLMELWHDSRPRDP